MTSFSTMATWNNRMARNNVQDDMLDQENQRIADNLSGKVSRLKSFAFDLQTEAEDSNIYLDGMGQDFDAGQGLLTGSVKRLGNMVSSGKNNRKLMCYIVLGLVALFIVIYFILSRIRG